MRGGVSVRAVATTIIPTIVTVVTTTISTTTIPTSIPTIIPTPRMGFMPRSSHTMSPSVDRCRVRIGRHTDTS